MSHKGSFYPVLFRRDWNLNVLTNDNGYANRYIVTLPQLGTGPAGIWSNSTWDCGPATLAPQNTMLWKADPALKFGVHWWVEVDSLIQPSSTYRRRGRMMTAEFGVIAEWRNGSDGVFFPGFPPQAGGALIMWDPGFFDAAPSTLIFTLIRPKIWSEGPPH